MSQVIQHGCYPVPENVTQVLAVDCQIRLYSPHPAMKMVIISQKTLSSDRVGSLDPDSVVRTVNHAVKSLKLNPAQVIWIESVPSSSPAPSSTHFHLINFDWQAGQATGSYRSPIHENWYLSWLESGR